jgi:hypothetical protein
MLMGCEQTYDEPNRSFCLDRLKDAQIDSKEYKLNIEIELTKWDWCVNKQRDPRADADDISELRKKVARSLCDRRLQVIEEIVKSRQDSILQLLFKHQNFCASNWIGDINDAILLGNIVEKINDRTKN